MKIPFNKPFIAGKELYYIAQAVMVEARLSGDGGFTRKCHSWLEEKLGCRRAFLTHSCTAALEMAAILCELGPGDEVIMPSFTFVSTANAFVLRGATPVFVDIRPDTFNIDEKKIEAAVTSRTKAIVVVHYGGVACEMDQIVGIAERCGGLHLIEDAAQALLSTYRNKALGTIGHLGCLSFHETKNIISGEGGALLVNDPKMVDRAEIIREKGTDRGKYFRNEVDKYRWVDIGSSFLPSELTAAFLWAQLEQAEKIIANRRLLYRMYMDRLNGLEKMGYFRCPFIGDGCADNGHLFYILTRSPAERARLISHLKADGILSVFHYVPLHSSPAGLRFGRTSGEMAVTDDVSDRLLRLPLYYELSEAQLDQVVCSIERFYVSKRKAGSG